MRKSDCIILGAAIMFLARIVADKGVDRGVAMIRRVLNYLLLAALLAVTVISAGLEILKFIRGTQ